MEAAGAIYHVVIQGNNGQCIVLDDADRLAFLEQLRGVAHLFAWECPAYCLMDTHLHFVVCTAGANLGRGMQRLSGGYAFRFNRRHQRHGHLFAGPYYARVIDGEAHFVRACVHIVLNPFAAAVCAHPDLWRWSSYRETVGLPDACHVAHTEVLLRLLDHDLSTARSLYRRLVEDALQRTGGAGVRRVPD